METSLLQKFKEALLSREVRSAMPTDLSSAELEQVPTDVLERAVFSARTMATGYLDAMEKSSSGSSGAAHTETNTRRESHFYGGHE
jgi:hypothetical protein